MIGKALLIRGPLNIKGFLNFKGALIDREPL